MTADSTSATAPPTGLCTHAGTPLRSDGVEARDRLLRAALPLFAAKGFAKTSIREIAASAGVNIASISYYFGDKAGLYRAVYNDPLDCAAQAYAHFAAAGLPLREALALYLQGFTDPLKEGDLAQQLMQLHFREMLEPTGLWQEHIQTQIAPMHQGLLEVLGRTLGLAQADDDLHRLAFSITALGIQMFVGADITRALRPALANSAAAIDTTHHRLTDFALAMVEDERQRRLRGHTP
jgi:AcrR family transcriptional regulator